MHLQFLAHHPSQFLRFIWVGIEMNEKMKVKAEHTKKFIFKA
jgi:hypothetical protein